MDYVRPSPGGATLDAMPDSTRAAEVDSSSEREALSEAARLRFPWKVTVVAVALLMTTVAAVSAWLPHETRPGPAPGESHQLGANQALCLHVGLVLERSTAYDLDLRLGLYASIDPFAVRPLHREASGMRAAVAGFPTADPGLLRAARAAAAASMAIIHLGNQNDYLETISGRAAAIGNLRNACYQVARFDVGAMKVLT
jgi:hypothetical protein